MCACAYCKDYPQRSSSYSPTRRDQTRDGGREVTRHHGDISSNSSRSISDRPVNGDVPIRPEQSRISPLDKQTNEIKTCEESHVTTIRMKFPDLCQGNSMIHISIEVAGTMYEGTIHAKPQLKGDGESGRLS